MIVPDDKVIMGPFPTCACIVAVFFGLPSLVIPGDMFLLMVRILGLVLGALFVNELPVYGRTLSDIIVIGGMIYILYDFTVSIML